MHAASYRALLWQSSDPLNTEINGKAAQSSMFLPCYGYKTLLLLPLPVLLRLLEAQGVTCTD